MTTFVIGDALFFIFVDETRRFLQTGDHTFDPFLELVHRNTFFVIPGGQQSRFVNQIRQVGSDKSGREFCDSFEIDGVVHFNLRRMDFQNRQTTFEVGAIDEYVAIETTGAHQRRVECFGAVGGSDDDHALIG